MRRALLIPLAAGSWSCLAPSTEAIGLDAALAAMPDAKAVVLAFVTPARPPVYAVFDPPNIPPITLFYPDGGHAEATLLDIDTASLQLTPGIIRANKADTRRLPSSR